MAGQMRCTMFFEDGKYGWSETYWSNTDTPQAATSLFIILAKLRWKLLGSGPNITYLRTSDDLVLRDADITVLDFNAQNAGIDKIDPDFGLVKGKINRAVDTPSDVPYSAILVRMSSGTLGHRMMYLRGAPDELIIDPAGPKQNQAWKTAFANWQTELQSGRWYWVGQNRNPLVNPFKLVTAVDTAPAHAVFTVPAHGFVTGQFVQASAFVGTNMPKGNYTVTFLTADTLSLKEYIQGGNAIYIRGGRFQANVKGLIGITAVLIRGETHRNTGRPFDSPVGRRR